MEAMFQLYRLGNLELTNRFVFTVSNRHTGFQGCMQHPVRAKTYKWRFPNWKSSGMPTKSRIYSAPYMPATSWLKDIDAA